VHNSPSVHTYSSPVWNIRVKPQSSFELLKKESSITGTVKHQSQGRRLTIVLSDRPVMFILVAMFNVVPFGIWVVVHDCTARRSAGASSPPEALRVQVCCEIPGLTKAKVVTIPSKLFKSNILS
jgi:hypothetical protein